MAQQPSSKPTDHRRAGEADVHPPYLYPDYKATRLRAPEKPLVILPESLSQVTAPAYGHGRVRPLDHDLTPGRRSASPGG
jgi:protocatechuate 3,4-dioxygenase beta subunit